MLSLAEREIIPSELNNAMGKRELEKLLSGIASGERESLEKLYELTRTAYTALR